MKLLKRPFRYRNSNVVLWLIGINVLVFLVQRFIPVEALLAMYPPRIIFSGWIWQFVTYIFVHDPNSIGHLLFNMFALFIFGIQVERHMGSREFLLYYLLTGILAGVFSFFTYILAGMYSNEIVPILMDGNIVIIKRAWHVGLLGASGAIFAVQLAYASFFPHSIIYIWGILPVKAWILVLGFAGLEVFFILTGSRGNVAHITHLAGFAFGWLYLVVRLGINPLRFMRR